MSIDMVNIKYTNIICQCDSTFDGMETPNYEFAQTINFRLYTLFGFWKTNSKNLCVERLYNSYSALVIFSTTVYTVLQIIDLKDSWSNIEELSINLSATLTSIFSLSKVYTFRIKIERVESLRRKLREFLNVPGIGISDEDREIFEKNAIRYWKTCKTLYSLIWPTILIWWIVSAMNKTLPVRQWFPFDVDDFGWIYHCVYLYQCILLGYFAAIVNFMDLILFCFIFLLCAHFTVLEKNIRVFGKIMSVKRTKKRSRKNQKKLGLIVKHHQEIFEAVKEVDDLFRTNNIIHFLGVAILISVTEYDLIHKTASMNIQFFRQVGNLVSAFVDLFIYSYYGTLLQEKSSGIVFAAYDIAWFDLAPTEQKMLVLIMLRGNRSAKITAGKLFALNFETYLAVIRVSYNLLAVLRQTN